MSELYYINDDGHTVFTAQYYLNRGSCCQSSCLHCPYGTTLKNYGLEFLKMSEDELSIAQQILNKANYSSGSISDMLLSEAFGGKKDKIVLDAQNMQSFRFILLKGIKYGVLQLSEGRPKKSFLKEHFNSQGLDESVIFDYFNRS